MAAATADADGVGKALRPTSAAMRGSSSPATIQNATRIVSAVREDFASMETVSDKNTKEAKNNP